MEDQRVEMSAVRPSDVGVEWLVWVAWNGQLAVDGYVPGVLLDFSDNGGEQSWCNMHG